MTGMPVLSAAEVQALSVCGGSLVMKARGRHKYGAKPTKRDGVTYHSGMEANYADVLELLKRAGQIREWRRQIPFPMVVNNQLICKLVIDFSVVGNDNVVRYVEAKGAQTPAWRLKVKLLAALWPETYAALTVVRYARGVWIETKPGARRTKGAR